MFLGNFAKPIVHLCVLATLITGFNDDESEAARASVALSDLEKRAAKGEWKLIRRRLPGVFAELSEEALRPFRARILHLHREARFHEVYPRPGLEELIAPSAPKGKRSYDSRNNNLKVWYDGDNENTFDDFEHTPFGRVFPVVFRGKASIDITGRVPGRRRGDDIQRQPLLFTHVGGEQRIETLCAWEGARAQATLVRGNSRTLLIEFNHQNTSFGVIPGRAFSARAAMSPDDTYVTVNEHGLFNAFPHPAGVEALGKVGFRNFPDGSDITVAGTPDPAWVEWRMAQWETAVREDFDGEYDPQSDPPELPEWLFADDELEPQDQDASEGSVLIVLDTSEGMFEDLDEGSRFSIACELASELASGLPAELAVGLMVYENPSGIDEDAEDEDCEHSRVAAQFELGIRESLIDALDEIEDSAPVGPASAADALTRAAEYLQDRHGPASIIVLTGDAASCSRDACEQAKRLASAHPDLRIDVVGIASSSADMDQLSCIVEATGGVVLKVDSDADLPPSCGRLRDALLEHAAGPDCVTSGFTTDVEGWTVVGDADLAWDDDSWNGSLKADDRAEAKDWYWQAPQRYLGDRSDAFGGELRYRLRTTKSILTKTDHVVLVGAGRRLVFESDDSLGPEWKAYRVPIDSPHWLDSDTRAPVDDTILREVLSDLESLRIRGEFLNGADTGWLDDVSFGVRSIPTERPAPGSWSPRASRRR